MKTFLESIDKIDAYTAGYSYEQFITDYKTLDAVIRNFEIIGEAANRLPDTIKSTNHHVDWQRIRGFRNRIVHDYMGIDYQVVWLIIEKYLPELRKQVLGIQSL